MSSFYAGAWPLQFEPNLSSESFFITRYLGRLAPTFALFFSFSYLHQDKKWPLYASITTLFSALFSLASICLVLTQHFSVAMPLIQLVGIIGFTLAYMTAGIYSFKPNKNARLFLFAFSFFYLGSCLRVLKNLGFIEPNFATDNGYQLGTLIHMLVMTGAIFWTYINMRKEISIAEYRLESEINLRKDQSNFITMVSHEFRTPLSIISATAENLLSAALLTPEIRKKIEKISSANSRISRKVLNYLQQEEVLDNFSSFETEEVDLNSVIADALLNFSGSDSAPIFKKFGPIGRVRISIKLFQMVIFNH
jgi:signal transduction histidine kinase